MTDTAPPASALTRVVLVTGVSGAGKSTALRSLEDLGFEAIDNVPLSLIERLVAPGKQGTSMALGIDIRTRDFDAQRFLDRIAHLAERPGLDVTLLYVDCDDEILVRRFEETRRRHPLAADRPVIDGIAQERALMTPLRAGAAIIVDTTEMNPGDMKPLLEGHFGGGADGGLTVFVTSFGFKNGLPRDADLVFDVRFLRNPHYEPDLKPQTGQDAPVAAFVESDPGFGEFIANLTGLLAPLLPRYAAEGKSYLTLAVGCTGGRHRSVVVAERLAAWIDGRGQRVRLRHRDLENPKK
ncbi:MAG: RNase adapter RapZ [Rhodospirillaceae bacterium]